VYVSVFDLFKIGVGPSSSHTMGPMRAAREFGMALVAKHLDEDLARCEVCLYGSLGATGRGHGTDTAILLGLSGEQPETIDLDNRDKLIAQIRQNKSIRLPGGAEIPFSPDSDLLFLGEQVLDEHPNGMRFQAMDSDGQLLLEQYWLSVGGGFVVNAGELSNYHSSPETTPPHPFDSARELIELCRRLNKPVSDLLLENEAFINNCSFQQVGERLLSIWKAMQDCIERGCQKEGVLPGGLNVRRRAPSLYRDLQQRPESQLQDDLAIIDWVTLYALAVNEENASGGRVVTAPTNGAAGIVPAVLRYYTSFVDSANDDNVVRFLLTAGAIGSLYKKNASISGAEVGCQGEVGVACSMAAGALTEVLGGTPQQVENAAEIGMEHNLGLTCDPVGGLVQIPCIERNAVAAVKAITASRLALRGDGHHVVELDKVIKTMRETGADMHSHYKETSNGGLAINIVEC